MSAYLAVVPFVVIAVTVITILTVILKLGNNEIDLNLQQVASSTEGVLKRVENNYTLEGTYNKRPFSIYLKNRGIGNNKALYYHIQLEANLNKKIVCHKNYVKSRLEAKINELARVKLDDFDFDYKNILLVDDVDFGEKILENQSFKESLIKIMDEYTEMRIKKNITLLKRYHVKLTEPEAIINTIENLINLAIIIEAESQKA